MVTHPMPSALCAWYEMNVATEMLVFGETYTHFVKLSRLVKWNLLTLAVLQKLMYFCQVLEYYRLVESDSAESMFLRSASSPIFQAPPMPLDSASSHLRCRPQGLWKEQFSLIRFNGKLSPCF